MVTQPLASPENGGQGLAFIEEGEEDGWGCFSLAGLLLGKEKIFLHSAGVCEVNFFLLGNTGYTVFPFRTSSLHCKWGFFYFFSQVTSVLKSLRLSDMGFMSDTPAYPEFPNCLVLLLTFYIICLFILRQREGRHIWEKVRVGEEWRAWERES